MKHILKCPQCREYTLKDKCKTCGSVTVRPQPPKWEPEDKYGKYRREEKKRLSLV